MRRFVILTDELCGCALSLSNKKMYDLIEIYESFGFTQDFVELSPKTDQICTSSKEYVCSRIIKVKYIIVSWS